MSRTVTLVGVCLIILGAVTMTGPMFGFSSLAADRSISAGTASGAEAYLGFEPVDEAIEGRQDTATVARIHNNLNSEMNLTTSVDTGPDLSVDSSFASSVNSNDYTALTLRCDGGGSSGNQTVTITVEEAAATGITVEGATMSVDVEYQCTGNNRGGNGGSGGTGPASFEATDVNTNGPTQQFQFNVDALPSNGGASIDLTDAHNNAGVSYENVGDGDVTLINGRGDVSFDSNVISYQGQGSQSGTVVIELTGFEITGDRDGTAYYSDDADREETNTFAVPAVVNDGSSVTTDGDVVVEDWGSAGNISAGGDVQIGQNANVNGEITADGNVSMGGGSTANGIDSKGSVHITDANINGIVTAKGDVTLKTGSTVNGVDTGGTVTIESSVSINGDITTSGNVIIGDGVNLPNVYSGGTVYIGCNVNENGEIDAEEIVYEEC